MSQISLPVRIILIGAVVFLAAWFTLLRPKAAEVPPVTTTPTTTTAPRATPAVTPAATTATKPDTATTSAPDPKPADAPAIPAEALAKLPKDVARALKAQKTLVLGVIADGATDYRPLADDDRYVRNSLRTVNRYDGDVFVKTVPLAKLSEYGAMVNDLGVNQTPSVVVVDSALKGRVLTGYVDRIAINQAIADARADSITPKISDGYLRDAERHLRSVRDAREPPVLPDDSRRAGARELLPARRRPRPYLPRQGRRPQDARQVPDDGAALHRGPEDL